MFVCVCVQHPVQTEHSYARAIARPLLVDGNVVTVSLVLCTIYRRTLPTSVVS